MLSNLSFQFIVNRAFEMTILSRRLIVSLLLLSACTHSPTRFLQDNLATGDALFKQGAFTEALNVWQSQPIEPDANGWLRQARAYHALGHTRDAQRCAERALSQVELPAQRNEILLVLADIELTLGLRQQAMEHLEQARPSIISSSTLAVTLKVFEARLALINQAPEQAMAHFQAAETLATNFGDTLMQLEIAVNRWSVLAESRTSSKTVFSTEEWRELHLHVNTLLTLNASFVRDFVAIKLARILIDVKAEPDVIESLLDTAIKTSRERGDQRLLSYGLGYQALLAERQQHWMQALDGSAQAAFAAQQVGALESLYLWEWQTARILGHQNQLNEALAAYRRAMFNLKSIRADLGSGAVFREKVAPLYLAFSDLLLTQANQTQDETRKQGLLREVREVLEQQKAAELQDYFQDRCVANFRAKSKNLEEISQHTAVIYPVMLADRTEILLGLADGMHQVIIPVGSKALINEIYDFRKKLEKRTTFQYLRPAQQLYQWLVAPLLADLRQHHVDTLVIVPDGALRSIPLAALHDGQRYLLEEFAVATTPGLALTDPQPLPTDKLTVLLNGLTESVQNFPPLPDVAKELDNIQQAYGGTVLKDDAFRLQTMGDAMEHKSYRIVHIASHGQFDQNPSKTFLLTYDAKLTMDMLERYLSVGKFRDEPVELLTLSACQTAAGDDRAALGLAGVAVKAGARSALASLWFINDQASSELVSHFYQHLQQRESKAKALQQAQLTLLANPLYRHAGFWAAFLIIGNWL